MATMSDFSKTYNPETHQATSVVRCKLNYKTLFTERFFHKDLGDAAIIAAFENAVWELNDKCPDSDIDIKVIESRHLEYDVYDKSPYQDDLDYMAAIGL